MSYCLLFLNLYRVIVLCSHFASAAALYYCVWRASGSHCCGHCKFSLAEFYLAIFVCILSPPSVKINLSRSRRLNRSDSSAPRISTRKRQWLNWFHCPPASRKYTIAQGTVDSRSIVQWPCRGCTVECRNRLRAIVVDNNEKRRLSRQDGQFVSPLPLAIHHDHLSIAYAFHASRTQYY